MEKHLAQLDSDVIEPSSYQPANGEKPSKVVFGVLDGSSESGRPPLLWKEQSQEETLVRHHQL